MARIAGVNIPLNKRVEIGLTYDLRGRVVRRSQQVLEKTGISPDTYVKDLTDDEISSCATRSTTISRSRVTCAGSVRRTSSG